MYIIVGLGNPGLRYKKTRHNMGFRAIDKLADKLGIKVSARKFKSLIGEGSIQGEKVILVKPQTYMNLSGGAVREVFSYFKADRDKLIVIYDDIDIPIGSLRIRKAGGPGTHNGMKSVVSLLGFNDFARVRLGVGSGSDDELLVDRVIGKVPKQEQTILDELADSAATAVCDIVTRGIDVAMNIHNVRKGVDDTNEDD